MITGDIAIDDIATYVGPCKTTHCDFEYDFCHFTAHVDGYNNTFDWLRGYGSTPNANTGPSEDHTTQTATGYYSYIDSGKRKANDRAGLISPLYTATSERLLILETVFYITCSIIANIKVHDTVGRFKTSYCNY